MTVLLNMINQLFTESTPSQEQAARHYDFDGAYRGM
jgi:hypothetical protein